MSEPKCASAYNLSTPHNRLSNLGFSLTWRSDASADFDETGENACADTVDFASLIHHAPFHELDLARVQYL